MKARRDTWWQHQHHNPNHNNTKSIERTTPLNANEIISGSYYFHLFENSGHLRSFLRKGRGLSFRILGRASALSATIDGVFPYSLLSNTIRVKPTDFVSSPCNCSLQFLRHLQFFASKVGPSASMDGISKGIYQFAFLDSIFYVFSMPLSVIHLRSYIQKLTMQSLQALKLFSVSMHGSST